MPSPLTLRAGYQVTVSQLVGGRPIVAADCNACDWRIDRTVNDIEAVELVTGLVADSIVAAIAHVSEHISERVALSPYPSGDST